MPRPRVLNLRRARTRHLVFPALLAANLAATLLCIVFSKGIPLWAPPASTVRWTPYRGCIRFEYATLAPFAALPALPHFDLLVVDGGTWNTLRIVANGASVSVLYVDLNFPLLTLPLLLGAFLSLLPLFERPAEDLCPTCGYNLHATPTRCPECGTVPKPSHAQSSHVAASPGSGLPHRGTSPMPPHRS